MLQKSVTDTADNVEQWDQETYPVSILHWLDEDMYMYMRMYSAGANPGF